MSDSVFIDEWNMAINALKNSGYNLAQIKIVPKEEKVFYIINSKAYFDAIRLWGEGMAEEETLSYLRSLLGNNNNDSLRRKLEGKSPIRSKQLELIGNLLGLPGIKENPYVEEI